VSQGIFTPSFISKGSAAQAPNHKTDKLTDPQRLFFIYKITVTIALKNALIPIKNKNNSRSGEGT